MEQMALNIVRRIPYAPEGFMLHSGISSDFERCHKLVSIGKSAFVFFQGARGSGKTHLAMHLEWSLQAHAVPVVSFSAEEFEGILNEATLALPVGGVLLVDDAQETLSKFAPGQSGRFVKFCETLKSNQNSLVLFSHMPLQEFKFDEHIASRLKSGSGFHLGAPEQKELPELVRLMSLQRGLKLAPKKIEYIASRVARDPAGVAQFLDERM